MKKRTLHISVFTACILLLLGLTITYLHESPPLLYYKQLIRWNELPTRLIRPAFKHIVNRGLPPKTIELRALFRGNRNRGIFVRFETDSDGIAYIFETFVKSGVTKERFDSDKLRSGRQVFVAIDIVQQEAGICLFDQESIESGLLLTGHFNHSHEQTAYQIFITDDQNSTVYIGATMGED